MDNNNQDVEIKISIDSSDVDKETKKVEKSINKMGKSIEKAGDKAEDAFDGLEKELKDIKSIWGGDDDKNKDSKEMTISEFAKEFGPDLMKAFRQNMSNLFDMIVSKSKQIKEDAKKAREDEAAKAQKESEANEKK